MLPRQGNLHILPGFFQLIGCCRIMCRARPVEQLFHGQLAKRSLQLLSLPGKYGRNAWLCRMTHHRHILLDNASLFPGDCFHRIPKEMHMIQPNGCNAAQAGLHHIGGIQSSSKTYFHHSRIHPFAFKGGQCQCRAHFKRGGL